MTSALICLVFLGRCSGRHDCAIYYEADFAKVRNGSKAEMGTVPCGSVLVLVFLVLVLVVVRVQISEHELHLDPHLVHGLLGPSM